MTREEFVYGLTACGCLLKDGKTWYEHNELIKCFEDLGLFEQEPVIDKIYAEIEKLRPNLRPEYMTDYDYAMVEVVDDIVAIIDKYRAESYKWVNFADDLMPIIDEAESEEKDENSD